MSGLDWKVPFIQRQSVVKIFSFLISRLLWLFVYVSPLLVRRSYWLYQTHILVVFCSCLDTFNKFKGRQMPYAMQTSFFQFTQAWEQIPRFLRMIFLQKKKRGSKTPSYISSVRELPLCQLIFSFCHFSWSWRVSSELLRLEDSYFSSPAHASIFL